MASILSWAGKKIKQAEQVVNRDVVQPIAHAPAAVERRVTQSAPGRAAQGVGLAALRSGVGTVQGIAGLDDALNHRLGLYNGASPFSQNLNKFAKNIDTTAGAQHINPVLYHGGQAAGDLAQFAIGSGEVKAASKIPQIGKALDIAAGPGKFIESKVAAKVAPMLDKGIAQRVIARGATNATKPGYQAANAAFTTLQAGKDISQGKKVTPGQFVGNLAMGGVALPVAGAIGHEAAAPVVRAGAKVLRNADLIAPSRLNPSEVAHLSKFSQVARSGAIMDEQTYKQGIAAAKKANVDYRDPKAVGDLLGAHMNYQTQVAQRKQAALDAKNKVVDFANEHPIGMTSGAVNNEGERIGMNGKPLKAGKAMRNDATEPMTPIQESLVIKQQKLQQLADKNAKKDQKQPIVTVGKSVNPGAKLPKAPNVPLKNPQKGEIPIPGDMPSNHIGPEKRTRFTSRTVQNSEKVSAATKAQTDASYTSDTMKNAAQRSQDFIAEHGQKKALNQTLAELNTKRGNASRDTLDRALELAARLDATGNEADSAVASQLYSLAGEHGSAHGQGSQILSRIAKRSPAGLRNKAINDLKGAGVGLQEDEKKQLDDIVKNIKGSGDTAGVGKALKDTNQSAAKQVADELKSHPANGAKKDLTPEERLAKRISVPANKPRQNDPITDMVSTLHKVANQVVPQAAKKVPRNPMELIGLAVKGEGEYRGVYEKAKALVQEKYKDNPAALDQLEQYFMANPDRVYSAGQLKKGIQTGLKDVNLGDIVRQHYSVADQAGRDLRTKLIKEAGLSEEEATQLSSDIQNRFDELTSNKKEQILTQIFGDKPTPIQKSAIQKLIELSNLGAFDSEKYASQLADKLGFDVSPAIKSEIQDHINTIQGLPDGHERDLAIAVLQKVVANHIPQSVGDRALSLWKAGLLSGVKTHGGNVISNTTFGALKKVSDIPATLIDKGISLGTKERTKTLTGKGVVRGTTQGFGTAKQTLKTGIDARNVGDKYEQHAELNTNSRLLKPIFGAANGVFRLLGAADQPTYYATLKNSLYDQAKAAGINAGKKGSALTQHMNELVQNPTEKMVDTAEREASKSVLAYDTLGSKFIQGGHNAIDRMPGVSDTGKAVAKTAINVLAPFVRVPSAFISRTVDFTPFGVGKEIFHQVASKQFDQRALSQAIGEGITGTGLIALGMALTKSNMISGDYPKKDQKEAARWKAEGITPNSVKIGGQWISLNYMGPVGLLFNAGNKVENAKGASAVAKASQAIGGLGQGLMGQSFLQGFSGFSDAIQDPERNAKSFINSEAGSIIPSISNDVANLTDKFQRQADTVPQSIASRVPGIREIVNPVKADVYGNKLKQPSGGIGPINPLRPSNQLNSPTLDEVRRLHQVDPNNPDLQVTPQPIGKTVQVNGNPVSLSNDQQHKLQSNVGQATQKAWGQLIKTPEYKALSDIDKAKALSDLRTDETAYQTRAFITENNIATYDKQATAKVASIGDGSATLADYAVPAGLGGSSTKSALYKSPDAEYKALKKTYDYNLKKGFDSVATQIKSQEALDKAKVGSTFDKETRDLYGLSNAELYKYVANDKNGKATVDKVLAYGDALADNGYATKNKFRDKYGNVTLGKGVDKNGKKTKGGGSGRGSKVNPFKKPPRIKTAAKGFKVKTARAPSFKTKHKALPKYAVKTPKVTVKKGALA